MRRVVQDGKWVNLNARDHQRLTAAVQVVLARHARVEVIKERIKEKAGMSAKEVSCSNEHRS
jgi:hypothetical protein